MSDKLNKLRELKELLDSGVITKEEFENLKSESFSEEKAAPVEAPKESKIPDDTLVVDNNKSINKGVEVNQIKQKLPNSGAILTLGILSIVTFFIVFVGLILSIIALAMFSKSNNIYLNSPDKYLQSSYNNIKSGKICAIIGLILNIVMILLLMVSIVDSF